MGSGVTPVELLAYHDIQKELKRLGLPARGWVGCLDVAHALASCLREQARLPRVGPRSVRPHVGRRKSCKSACQKPERLLSPACQGPLGDQPPLATLTRHPPLQRSAP